MLAVARLSRRITLLAVLALPAAASAQTIDFDDILTSSYTALGTYRGFDWSNTFALAAGTSFAPVAAASSPNVIFPGFGAVSGFTLASPGTFTLGSIDFVQWAPFGGAAAPSTTVTGYTGGTQLFQQTVTLGSSYQTTVFNWAGIDQVTFDQNGAGWYVADNIVPSAIPTGPVTSAPEPATVTLLTAGLAALGLGVRRRRA